MGDDFAGPTGSAPTDWVQVLRNKLGAMSVNADLLVDLTDGPARDRALAMRRSAEAAAWAIEALEMAMRHPAAPPAVARPGRVACPPSQSRAARARAARREQLE